jgi:diaminohydroxyphosphoribosylaminopyrimidine deaminase/5-amino-6-(5-phosphoribosylamino)uracil reductase
MRHALRLAARGLGRVAPNPAVGCVIVKEGRIVGRGWTQPGGRPHAEPVALAQAGADARGATLYVTLEPCNHHGKTPPCAEAIIRAQVARVVIATRDPNPDATGGAEALRRAGIAVEEGVCEAEARALNAGFFSVIGRGPPYVAVKIAVSRDYKITSGNPAHRWLTGDEARAYGHLLRARHDAILTGIGTLLADDPQLTCRLPGLEERSPQRILLDAKLRVPLGAKLLPAWIFTTQAALDSRADKAHALRLRGAELIAVDAAGDRLDLRAVLAALAQRGVTRLMVEAGAALTEAFLRGRLADTLYLSQAPFTVGRGGIGIDLNHGLSHAKRRILGQDTLEVLERPENLSIIPTPARRE